MDISRVEAFCEDKHLGRVMRALMGLCIKIDVTPVVNIEKRDGKLEAPTNGTRISMFKQWLKRKKLENFNANDTREFLASIGQGESGYSYLLQGAIKAGVIKKTGKGRKSAYRVL